MGFKTIKVDTGIDLRAPKIEYASTLFQLIESQRSALEEWLPWIQQMKCEKAVSRFLQECIVFNCGGQKFVSFIFYQNKLVGSLSLIKIDYPDEKAEIGYWLSPAVQGRKIMIRSCHIFINYIFRNLDLNRLIIRVNAQNTRSLKIPLKLGFKEEKALFKDTFQKGKFHNTKIFSLLKKDLK